MKIKSLEEQNIEEQKKKEKQNKRDEKILQAKFKKIAEVLPMTKSYGSFIMNALQGVLEYEIGCDMALTNLKFDVDENFIDFDKTAWFNLIRSKFSELIFLDRMLHVTGFMEYRDVILNEYISTNMFTKKTNDLKTLLTNLTNTTKNKVS